MIDKHGNTIILGLAENQWLPVILFAACGLPSRNIWWIIGNAVIWYAAAYVARRLL